MSTLGKAGQVVLDAAGGGTLRFGPSDNNRGPQRWEIDGLLWKTTRAGVSAAGVAPVPRIEVYIDSTDGSNAQVYSYDGSFGTATGSATVIGNQQLVAVWTGGQVGDVAILTVTGQAV